MNNFIVRVIRHQGDKRSKVLMLDGVVERVNAGGRQAFHNAEELWAILVSADENNQSQDGRIVTREKK